MHLLRYTIRHLVAQEGRIAAKRTPELVTLWVQDRKVRVKWDEEDEDGNTAVFGHWDWEITGLSNSASPDSSIA